MNKHDLSLVLVLTATALVVAYNAVDHESMPLSNTARNVIRCIVLGFILAGLWAMFRLVPL